MPGEGSGDKSKLEQQLQQQKNQYQQQEYQELVNQIKPKPPVLKNLFWAFVIGGLITAFAQLVSNGFVSAGMAPKPAATAALVVMIFLGALLTGLGVYDDLARIGGAGAIVPITGFANSIVSPAMEFKHEGYIFGLGSRLFMVAGPVLVYGFVVSIIIGLIAYFFM